ncbi:MAG: hypothetical protein JOZ81_11275, partial [Chloroflexi bacterium]|nr:hypothetical protein [Chloroflexota bacterium]
MIVESAPTEPLYPSLAALRLKHRELRTSFDRNNPSAQALSEIEQFLRAAARTGSVLFDEQSRTAAQGIVDYWTAALYRARRHPPETQLDPFNPPSRPPSVVCPFPGLSPFDDTTRDYFLGRDKVVADLCARLVRGRFVVVTGPRGSGKSSIVRAGLVPALRSGALPGSDRWRYLGPVVPGRRPLHSLALALAPSPDDPAAGMAEEWAAEAAAVLRVSPRQLGDLLQDQGPSLLVVDQLEDVLPGPGEVLDDDRQAFIDCLIQLITRDDVPCALVATRTDDPVDPAYHAADALLSESASFDVPDLGTAELRAAIVRPADLVGVTFDPDIVEDLVRALVGVPVSPPLLQFVLAHLWDKRDGFTISAAAYDALMWDPRRRRTNAGAALARIAQQQFDQLAEDPAAQAAFKSILLELVVPEEGSEIRMLRLPLGALRQKVGDDGAFERALAALVAGRLVRCSAEGAEETWVEVVHAGLARNWPMLDGWLVDVRLSQARRRQLQTATRSWLEHDRTSDALWGEKLLDTVDEDDPYLGRAEREFLARSHAAVRRHKLMLALLKWGAITSVAVGILLAFAVVYVHTLQLAAEARSAHAEQLASQADLHANDPAAQLLIALAALGEQPDKPGAPLSLVSGLVGLGNEAENADARFSLLSALERNRQITALLRTDQSVTTIVASPDGALLAGVAQDPSGASAAQIVIWDSQTLNKLDRFDLSEAYPGPALGKVTALALNATHTRAAFGLPTRDGYRLGVLSTQDGLPLAPRESGTPQRFLQMRGQTLQALRFRATADGSDVLASLDGEGIHTWDLATGASSTVRLPTLSPTSQLSPDGQLLADPCAPSDDSNTTCTLTVRASETGAIVGSVPTTQLLAQDCGSAACASGPWFSADSTQLAMASADGASIVIVDARQPSRILARRARSGGPVARVALNQSLIAVASAACSLKTCTSDDAAQLQYFDPVPTGAEATGQPTRASGAPVPSTWDSVQSIVPLSSGGRVAVPMTGGVALLDLHRDIQGPDVTPSTGDRFNAITVRIDANSLPVPGCADHATGSGCPAGALHLQDVRPASQAVDFLSQSSDQTVTAVAAGVIADQFRIAAGYKNGNATVWDSSGNCLVVPRSEPGACSVLEPATPSMISALAFAPDGRLAVAGAGDSVRVWRYDDP